MASQHGMVRFKESDRAEVEKALADLRAKLTDEHYRAAMLVLKRRHELDELLEDTGGNLPYDLGDLAVRFRGADTTPPPKRGRGAQPAPELDGPRKFIGVFDLKPRPLSLVETLRRLIADENPGAPASEVNVLAEGLAGKMTGIRRRSKPKV
ncbi:MAG: hypothetical protein WC540_10045 [Sulfuritalea sp.]